jgi:hypothetical protein
MTIEQTTQLIQITFNSLLLVLISGMILAVLLLRQTLLESAWSVPIAEDPRRAALRKRQVGQNLLYCAADDGELAVVDSGFVGGIFGGDRGVVGVCGVFDGDADGVVWD